METIEPIFSFDIGGFPVNIDRDIIVQWVIILILTLSAYLLTRNLKRIPDKKQVILEAIYSYAEGLVKGNMGDSFSKFIPYVGTLVIYLIAVNFTGLIGVEPPSQNISVAFGFGISSFLVINLVALKRNGPLGYVKAFGKPYLLMLPINILERIMLPVSLSLRLFGNMMAATLIVNLVYNSLKSLGTSLLGSFGFIAETGLPIIVHGYFDLFDGTIQMLVFTMLTINYIKMTSEHH